MTAQAAPCSEVILPVGRTRSTLGCGSEKRLRKCGAAECWSRSDLPEPHLWTAFQFSVYATRKNKLRVDGKPQWLAIPIYASFAGSQPSPAASAVRSILLGLTSTIANFIVEYNWWKEVGQVETWISDAVVQHRPLRGG